MVSLSNSIFKAYDIRGVIGVTLDIDIARQIGQAFGTISRASGERTVIVGRDGRLSGLNISNSLISGLQDTGTSVVDLGIVTTPMVYFSTYKLGIKSAIVVTASHNPPDYNGFKIVLSGQAIYGDAIQELHQTIIKGNIRIKATASEFLYRRHDIKEAYFHSITSSIKLFRPMRIIIDCGNGVAGAFAGELYRALGCEVQELFCEVNGSFPNHHPDPANPENLKDIIQVLKKSDAEIGLAFDGDGDRLGVVRKDGCIIYPDRQLMLFATDVLERYPGCKILYDVKCTGHLEPWILKHGGKPLMWKTGHSLIKAKMRETGALLGGEMSGHIFFNERWYGFDDGLYTGVRLLELLSRNSHLLAAPNLLRQFSSSPELQLRLQEGENFLLISKLNSRAIFPSASYIRKIDGLRVEYSDGFGLVRSSNTMPIVTICFEASSEKALARIKSEFRIAILDAKPDAILPF